MYAAIVFLPLLGSAIAGLLGRIIGAAEIYDALCTSRPYQEKMSPYEAVQRMGELAGTALDPRIYASLAEVVRRRRSLVFLEGGDTTSS